MSDATAQLVETMTGVTRSLIPRRLDNGVLIPLKTTLELGDDHACSQALITRAPVKCASAIIRLAFQRFPVLFHMESASASFFRCCAESVVCSDFVLSDKWRFFFVGTYH